MRVRTRIDPGATCWTETATPAAVNAGGEEVPGLLDFRAWVPAFGPQPGGAVIGP